jgi:hypothetical protein
MPADLKALQIPHCHHGPDICEACGLTAEIAGLTAACADLRAERDALREALRSALDDACPGEEWDRGCCLCEQCDSRARAALSRGGK